MKKLLLCGLMTAALTVGTVGQAFAAPAQWTEDNPTIAIYEPGTISDDYNIEYIDAYGDFADPETVPADERIYLLMINGGFVPNTRVVIEYDTTLVPLRIVSELLGGNVEWNGKERTVTVSDGANTIVLRVDSTYATFNGESSALDAPARIIDGSTFVPFRFIAEALGAEIGYQHELNIGAQYEGEDLAENISLITLEKAGDVPIYTVDDGLEAAITASIETYEFILEHMEDNGFEFNGTYKDYDPQAISYVLDFGRYFVYELEGFESMYILYDRYTGELWSRKAAMPFFYIDEGFPNIEWFYQ